MTPLYPSVLTYIPTNIDMSSFIRFIPFLYIFLLPLLSSYFGPMVFKGIKSTEKLHTTITLGEAVVTNSGKQLFDLSHFVSSSDFSAFSTITPTATTILTSTVSAALSTMRSLSLDPFVELYYNTILFNKTSNDSIYMGNHSNPYINNSYEDTFKSGGVDRVEFIQRRLDDKYPPYPLYLSETAQLLVSKSLTNTNSLMNSSINTTQTNDDHQSTHTNYSTNPMSGTPQTVSLATLASLRHKYSHLIPNCSACLPLNSLGARNNEGAIPERLYPSTLLSLERNSLSSYMASPAFTSRFRPFIQPALTSPGRATTALIASSYLLVTLADGALSSLLDGSSPTYLSYDDVKDNIGYHSPYLSSVAKVMLEDSLTLRWPSKDLYYSRILYNHSISTALFYTLAASTDPRDIRATIGESLLPSHHNQTTSPQQKTATHSSSSFSSLPPSDSTATTPNPLHTPLSSLKSATMCPPLDASFFTHSTSLLTLALNSTITQPPFNDQNLLHVRQSQGLFVGLECMDRVQSRLSQSLHHVHNMPRSTLDSIIQTTYRLDKMAHQLAQTLSTLPIRYPSSSSLIPTKSARSPPPLSLFALEKYFKSVLHGYPLEDRLTPRYVPGKDHACRASGWPVLFTDTSLNLINSTGYHNSTTKQGHPLDRVRSLNRLKLDQLYKELITIRTHYEQGMDKGTEVSKITHSSVEALHKVVTSMIISSTNGLESKLQSTRLDKGFGRGVSGDDDPLNSLFPGLFGRADLVGVSQALRREISSICQQDPYTFGPRYFCSEKRIIGLSHAITRREALRVALMNLRDHLVIALKDSPLPIWKTLQAKPKPYRDYGSLLRTIDRFIWFTLSPRHLRVTSTLASIADFFRTTNLRGRIARRIRHTIDSSVSRLSTVVYGIPNFLRRMREYKVPQSTESQTLIHIKSDPLIENEENNESDTVNERSPSDLATAPSPRSSSIPTSSSVSPSHPTLVSLLVSLLPKVVSTLFAPVLRVLSLTSSIAISIGSYFYSIRQWNMAPKIGTLYTATPLSHPYQYASPETNIFSFAWIPLRNPRLTGVVFTQAQAEAASSALEGLQFSKNSALHSLRLNIIRSTDISYSSVSFNLSLNPVIPPSLLSAPLTSSAVPPSPSSLQQGAAYYRYVYKNVLKSPVSNHGLLSRVLAQLRYEELLKTTDLLAHLLSFADIHYHNNSRHRHASHPLLTTSNITKDQEQPSTPIDRDMADPWMTEAYVLARLHKAHRPRYDDDLYDVDYQPPSLSNGLQLGKVDNHTHKTVVHDKNQDGWSLITAFDKPNLIEKEHGFVGYQEYIIKSYLNTVYKSIINNNPPHLTEEEILTCRGRKSSIINGTINSKTHTLPQTPKSNWSVPQGSAYITVFPNSTYVITVVEPECIDILSDHVKTELSTKEYGLEDLHELLHPPNTVTRLWRYALSTLKQVVYNDSDITSGGGMGRTVGSSGGHGNPSSTSSSPTTQSPTMDTIDPCLSIDDDPESHPVVAKLARVLETDMDRIITLTKSCMTQHRYDVPLSPALTPLLTQASPMLSIPSDPYSTLSAFITNHTASTSPVQHITNNRLSDDGNTNTHTPTPSLNTTHRFPDKTRIQGTELEITHSPLTHDLVARHILTIATNIVTFRSHISSASGITSLSLTFFTMMSISILSIAAIVNLFAAIYFFFDPIRTLPCLLTLQVFVYLLDAPLRSVSGTFSLFTTSVIDPRAIWPLAIISLSIPLLNSTIGFVSSAIYESLWLFRDIFPDGYNVDAFNLSRHDSIPSCIRVPRQNQHAGYGISIFHVSVDSFIIGFLLLDILFLSGYFLYGYAYPFKFIPAAQQALADSFPGIFWTFIDIVAVCSIFPFLNALSVLANAKIPPNVTPLAAVVPIKKAEKDKGAIPSPSFSISPSVSGFTCGDNINENASTNDKPTDIERFLRDDSSLHVQASQTNGSKTLWKRAPDTDVIDSDADGDGNNQVDDAEEKNSGRITVGDAGHADLADDPLDAVEWDTLLKPPSFNRDTNAAPSASTSTSVLQDTATYDYRVKSISSSSSPTPVDLEPIPIINKTPWQPAQEITSLFDSMLVPFLLPSIFLLRSRSSIILFLALLPAILFYLANILFYPLIDLRLFRLVSRCALILHLFHFIPISDPGLSQLLCQGTQCLESLRQSILNFITFNSHQDDSITGIRSVLFTAPLLIPFRGIICTFLYYQCWFILYLARVPRLRLYDVILRQECANRTPLSLIEATFAIIATYLRARPPPLSTTSSPRPPPTPTAPHPLNIPPRATPRLFQFTKYNDGYLHFESGDTRDLVTHMTLTDTALYTTNMLHLHRLADTFFGPDPTMESLMHWWYDGTQLTGQQQHPIALRIEYARSLGIDEAAVHRMLYDYRRQHIGKPVPPFNISAQTGIPLTNAGMPLCRPPTHPLMILFLTDLSKVRWSVTSKMPTDILASPAMVARRYRLPDVHHALTWVAGKPLVYPEPGDDQQTEGTRYDHFRGKHVINQKQDRPPGMSRKEAKRVLKEATVHGPDAVFGPSGSHDRFAIRPKYNFSLPSSSSSSSSSLHSLVQPEDVDVDYSFIYPLLAFCLPHPVALNDHMVSSKTTALICLAILLLGESLHLLSPYPGALVLAPLLSILQWFISPTTILSIFEMILSTISTLGSLPASLPLIGSAYTYISTCNPFRVFDISVAQMVLQHILSTDFSILKSPAVSPIRSDFPYLKVLLQSNVTYLAMAIIFEFLMWHFLSYLIAYALLAINTPLGQLSFTQPAGPSSVSTSLVMHAKQKPGLPLLMQTLRRAHHFDSLISSEATTLLQPRGTMIEELLSRKATQDHLAFLVQSRHGRRWPKVLEERILASSVYKQASLEAMRMRRAEMERVRMRVRGYIEEQVKGRGVSLVLRLLSYERLVDIRLKVGKILYAIDAKRLTREFMKNDYKPTQREAGEEYKGSPARDDTATLLTSTAPSSFSSMNLSSSTVSSSSVSPPTPAAASTSTVDMQANTSLEYFTAITRFEEVNLEQVASKYRYLLTGATNVSLYHSTDNTLLDPPPLSWQTIGMAVANKVGAHGLVRVMPPPDPEAHSNWVISTLAELRDFVLGAFMSIGAVGVYSSDMATDLPSSSSTLSSSSSTTLSTPSSSPTSSNLSDKLQPSPSTGVFANSPASFMCMSVVALRALHPGLDDDVVASIAADELRNEWLRLKKVAENIAIAVDDDYQTMFYRAGRRVQRITSETSSSSQGSNSGEKMNLIHDTTSHLSHVKTSHSDQNNTKVSSTNIIQAASSPLTYTAFLANEMKKELDAADLVHDCNRNMTWTSYRPDALKPFMLSDTFLFPVTSLPRQLRPRLQYVIRRIAYIFNLPPEIVSLFTFYVGLLLFPFVFKFIHP